MSAVSTYRCGTSSTAAVVSLTTKATLAMNRNIVFWKLPIPKKKKVSGINAATGMLRPKIASGAVKLEGSPQALLKLSQWMDAPNPAFPIVTR